MAESILIVDDEAPIRLLYQTEFGQAGYRVVTADCGEEALLRVAEQNFALVILDIEMADISGLEVLRRIRQVRPETKIVLNTAYHIYKSDFQSWLADDYLVKSSDLSSLKAAVRNLLEGK